MKLSIASPYLLLLLLFPLPSSPLSPTNHGTIVFTTLGRSRYAFDIFTISLPHNATPTIVLPNPNTELQITDGQSVNFNGFFTDHSESVLYISERNGTSNIYINHLDFDTHGRRSSLQIPDRVNLPLLPEQHSQVSMKDRPSISGEFLVYVSTHEKPNLPRKSWAAVYSTNLVTGETRRLTPVGVSDLSPSVSPSGEWTMVASTGEKGWEGEIHDLKTHLFVFKTKDGSERTKVLEYGGWPCWSDDSTVFFHRQSEDGWWSIYRAAFGDRSFSPATIERITPPGLHAFTPAAAKNGKFIAVATRRPGSEFRHIEVFDLVLNEFLPITMLISPKTHHYNPFISSDSTKIGYHRCRGVSNSNPSLLLENLKSPSPKISLFRIDGSFPSFSPTGNQIAYVGFPGVYVVNRDGSNKRKLLSGDAFTTAWDWKREGVIYTSYGPNFAEESTRVDIVSISFKDDGVSHVKKLTEGGDNNAFPSSSPDGKFVVFRSGRSGHKNLYIMDSIEGEKGGLWRLTEGEWTDTMCNWSPDGEWIVFASDRDNPGEGTFALYFIHPNGTGLKKVLQSGMGGRANHPWFSPDSKSIVFTSDLAGVSAEPISNPHHYQPYGEIFTASASDGSGLRRLTHNSYEDGTPTWGPIFMTDEKGVGGTVCVFDDCTWLGNNNSHDGAATARGCRSG